jgi:alpha-galactosidase
MNRRDLLKMTPALPLGAHFALLSAGSASAQTAGPFGPAKKEKMVLIGAGSAMFTQGIVIDWIHQRLPGDWEIALVDTNPVILEATEKLVRRYMLSAERSAKITATTERKDVLQDATVVICTIGVGSRRAWEQDVFVPRKFGIYQPVGDSVMPGGVSRALRMIPPMLDIARDAGKMCPNARFINYSNPLTAIVRALRRENHVPAIGLCMGVEETIEYLCGIAGVQRDQVTARWAGVNHLTWITELRLDGEDLWPAIRQKVEARRRNGIDRGSWNSAFGHTKTEGLLSHPFSWELFDEFHAFPAPMDRHVTEYFPDRFPGGKYYGSFLGVDAYSFEGTIAHGDKIYDDTLSLARKTGPVDDARLKATEGEHMQTMQILDSYWKDRHRWYSVNVPNNGCVGNLPRDAVLEVPAVATARGMVAPPFGEVPIPIAAILLRRLAAVEAVVEAAVTGNRKLFVEALILDGGVTDYDTATKLAEALLKAQAQHLPQFA